MGIINFLSDLCQEVRGQTTSDGMPFSSSLYTTKSIDIRFSTCDLLIDGTPTFSECFDPSY